MQARTWTSSNGKWEMEFLGNVAPTRESGVYVLLAEDMVHSPMKDLVNIVVTVSQTDPTSAQYMINTSAKLPAYVLKQAEAMVYNARYVGLESTAEYHGDMIEAILAKTPAPMLAPAPEAVAPEAPAVEVPAVEVAAASEDKGMQIDFLEDMSQAQYVCRCLGLMRGYTDCTEEEAVLRMAKDVHHIANATAQLMTRTDYTYMIEVTEAATGDKRLVAVTIPPNGEAVAINQDQPAPVEVQNFMNLTAAERLQAVPDASVQSWVVFQRFLVVWGEMLRKVKQGQAGVRELARFVFTEQVYKYDVTIQASGGPTTRLAQLLNRGDIYRDEFLKLTLSTMEKTVEHAEIACRVLVTALTPWLQEKWQTWQEKEQELLDVRQHIKMTTYEYQQHRLKLQQQYGLSESEMLMAMQAGLLTN